MEDTELETALQSIFKLKSFRDDQLKAIKSILNNNDTIVIKATGGGKSLIYQFPSVISEGTSIILSPLIALMGDQVSSLSSKGISAGVYNSTMTPMAKKASLADLQAGKYKLFYCSPETFITLSDRDAFSSLNISMVVLDEAHCLSQWGNDFRTDYLRLKPYIAKLKQSVPKKEGRIPTVALTATATPDVICDIKNLLFDDTDNIKIFRSSANRHNLNYYRHIFSTQHGKLSFLVEKLNEYKKYKKPSIIYCATRKQAEELSKNLHEYKFTGCYYHAGLPVKSRQEAQQKFMSNSVDFLCATKAFGLGIDKPDTRVVMHYNIPDSIESYVQEAGRAGRDGEDADCHLLFAPEDIDVQNYFIKEKYLTLEQLESVLALIKEPKSLDDILSSSKFNQNGLNHALYFLEKHGLAQNVNYKWQAATQGNITCEIKAAYSCNIKELKAKDESKLKEMKRYATDSKCAKNIILEYFGQPELSSCNKEDNCNCESLKAMSLKLLANMGLKKIFS